MSPISALESKLVNQFCEDENGALIYNRITNGGNKHNGYRPNGYDNHNNVLNGNNGYDTMGPVQMSKNFQTKITRFDPAPFRLVCRLTTPIEKYSITCHEVEM